jgi:hypothetical protein
MAEGILAAVLDLNAIWMKGLGVGSSDPLLTSAYGPTNDVWILMF